MFRDSEMPSMFGEVRPTRAPSLRPFYIRKVSATQRDSHVWGTGCKQAVRVVRHETTTAGFFAVGVYNIPLLQT